MKSSGTPDFDYMEQYILTFKKLAIADVVKYKDKAVEISKGMRSERIFFLCKIK